MVSEDVVCDDPITDPGTQSVHFFLFLFQFLHDVLDNVDAAMPYRVCKDVSILDFYTTGIEFVYSSDS